MPATTVSSRSILQVLSKGRLGEIARTLGVTIKSAATKDAHVDALANSGVVELSGLLESLGRDELKAICREHSLDDSGRARAELIERLLGAARHRTISDRLRVPEHLRATRPATRTAGDPFTPKTGDIVQVRHRQYLVEGVLPPPEPGHQTVAQLVCLDDDAQGRKLQVLWELELGAKVIKPEAHGLGQVEKIDEPRAFAAYLHALKWGCVTATDARLFQAPFRAGIQLHNHQLTPLKKALELPRANLFIADDVGLGKTIESGLVLQELLLRQRIDWVLIVCPASVVLQWRDEMEKRFGLRFEVYNRNFVGRKRQERGFAVNPWTTFNRFIISYPLLRKPEYLDPLHQFLGEQRIKKKSLLILDEAHTAAPATASKYAVDSRITKVLRRSVAPRFENRLFLSATPHNGHSNSFTSLLNMLDPQRFTPGVEIKSTKQLEPIMVRRLKSDLRELGTADGFPKRHIGQIELTHEGGNWTQRYVWDEKPERPEPIGSGTDAEIRLAQLLAEYTKLMKPEKGRGQLIFINLQKRLLSCVDAFYRTLKLHAENVGKGAGASAERELFDDEDEYGADDDKLEEAAGAQIASGSRSLLSPQARAKQLLDEMLTLADQARNGADAKVLALVSWIRAHQCKTVQVGGAMGKGSWTDRRLIVFTEYGDTKNYLKRLLGRAVEDTADGKSRIMFFHGGMSDEQREEVQRAFNGSPDQYPVRILIATDAAREGVNLQGHCADLVHFDVPWNPARMEQRNGRIDRTMQPEPEVRCSYFVYPQRPEDKVLKTLVSKVDRIQAELGSLGNVILERFTSILDKGGIDDSTFEKLEGAEKVDTKAREVTERELEAQRVTQDKLRKEDDEAGKILNASRQVMDFDPVLLRDAIDVGCELLGAGRLTPTKPPAEEAGIEAFTLPQLPDSWQRTLDTMRPPRARDEDFFDWRKKPPMPVVLRAPSRINSGLVHLHLQHPFVQRVLSRFLSQGFSAHDLSRVTIVRNPNDSLTRVIAFGRLSLFGPGATRLHDELIGVAAAWLESKGKGHLQPFGDEKADREALSQLEKLLKDSPDLSKVGAQQKSKLVSSAPEDFSKLWPHIEHEADSQEHKARRKLEQRAEIESKALRKILEDQRAAIEATIEERRQKLLDFGEAEKDQREQWEQDRKYMDLRLEEIEEEVEEEPKKIAELYRVVLRRLEPVGLVYVSPGTR